MKIFVISMLRSTDRRASITKQFREAGLEFEFIDAVDGRTLTPEFITENVNQERYNYWPELRQPGQIGCALSHRAAYQRMVADNIPIAAVIEDDIVLSSYFAQVLPRLAAEVRPNEVMLMFFHSSLPIGLSQVGSVDLSNNHTLFRLKEYKYFGSTAGYVIPISTATALANAQQPIQTTPDDWARFHNVGAVQSFRLVLPFLVEMAGFKSTIGYVDPKSIAGKVSELVDRYKLFPFNLLLSSLRKRNERKRRMYTIDKI